MAQLDKITQALPPEFERFVRRSTKSVIVANRLARASDYSSELTAYLAGVASDPELRFQFDRLMDTLTQARTEQALEFIDEVDNTTFVDEVFIGGGLHAAIYCSTKVALGLRPPLVIEERQRFGGVFALGELPVFKLNSRNRQEGRGVNLPGTAGPLNTIPGGILQASDISGDEYQSQDVLAFAIRVNLFLSARIWVGTRAEPVGLAVEDSPGRYQVACVTGTRRGFVIINTNRVIQATGLGDAQKNGPRSDRVLSFDEFVERVGSRNNPFPMLGIKTVAVIGAGDSGNTAVEYFLGQGPSIMPPLDFVEKIYWYGQQQTTKQQFERMNRSRYAGIARYMPREDDPEYYSRVQAIPRRATRTTAQDNGRILVSDNQGTRLVDLVVYCTGYNDNSAFLYERFVQDEDEFLPLVFNNQDVAMRVLREELYKVGPCAGLPVREQELEDAPALRSIPDNSVSIFRYLNRTALTSWRLG